MLSEDDVREALRVCFDPELPANIVDLGLVEKITLQYEPDVPGIAPRFRVTVDLLRRTEDEQREAMLQAQVANRLAGIYAVSRSEVQFVEQPGWSAERMTEAARVQLGLNRAPKPGLIQIQL